MADKVTIRGFGDRLKKNEYKNAGGARKAVGRFSGWSDKLKGQARNMIEAHFGVETPKKVLKAKFVRLEKEDKPKRKYTKRTTTQATST